MLDQLFCMCVYWFIYYIIVHQYYQYFFLCRSVSHSLTTATPTPLRRSSIVELVSDLPHSLVQYIDRLLHSGPTPRRVTFPGLDPYGTDKVLVDLPAEPTSSPFLPFTPS